MRQAKLLNYRGVTVELKTVKWDVYRNGKKYPLNNGARYVIRGYMHRNLRFPIFLGIEIEIPRPLSE